MFLIGFNRHRIPRNGVCRNIRGGHCCRHCAQELEEYDDGEIEEAAAAPENRHIRIENKNFFFSCKKNAQGRYITVAEIKGNFRNTILIPESGWDDFRDVLDDYVKQCKEHD